MRVLRGWVVGLGLWWASQAAVAGCHLGNYGSLNVDMVGNRATTLVKINGVDTRFIIDTGAFFNTMSSANAAALGLRLEPAPFGFRVGGVGGTTNVQQAHVKAFGILGTTFKDVAFIVGGTDTGSGLLGANLLDFADVELDLEQGKITFFKTEHCDKASLAYWSKDGASNMVELEPSNDTYDRRTFFNVLINGRKVRAVLDSGAVATVITRSAAERAGIDLNAPGVKAGSLSAGIGAKPVKTWTVAVDSFAVGTELIQHTQMQVIDGRMGDDTEMLVGVDFILAHRIFIANSQKKLYFTYNGGRVFTFAASSDGDAAAGTAGTASAANNKTASDYALSGQAQLSRGESAAAVADLSEAIRMAPDQADYYLARARAQVAAKQPDAALADLDKTLSLQPTQVDALLMRAELRLAHKQRDGAAADVAAASALLPPGSAQARAAAFLYIQLDQPAAALPLLDEWIRLHANDALLGSALNQRCWARALSNQQLDEALKDCRKAIRRDGENAAYLDSLGLVQLRLGNYPESIKAYETAVARAPNAAWSRYGQGIARIRAGQVEAGKADLAAARAIDPEIERRAAKYGLSAPQP